MTDLPPPTGSIDVFLKSSGADASGTMDADGLTLLAGSRGRSADTPLLGNSYRKRRASTFESGVFRQAGDELVPTQDQRFDSPSGAWYEASAFRRVADAYSVARDPDTLRERFANGEDAIPLLYTSESTRSFADFAEGMRSWAAQQISQAFNGFSGQMLLNQLVKRSDDERSLADLFADVLRTPNGIGDAQRTIGRIVERPRSDRQLAAPHLTSRSAG